MRWARLAALAVLMLLAGCAHYPLNSPIERHNAQAGYRLQNLPDAANSGSLLVVLTFSGGGTRAAALAFGVVEQLAKTEIVWEGQRKRLLDEVDIISAVSGGSYTAAYYALYRDRIFSDFERDFLKRDVQGELTRKILAPFNLIKASSPTYGRVDLLSEYLNEEIFRGATFGDLLRQGKRPFIIVNASDMSLGARFEFTQDQFDPICSDLSRYTLSRAVAASSAVPIVFSPLTLRNYAGTCGYSEPARPTLSQKAGAAESRRRVQAAELRSYLDAQSRPFIHLLDGGLSDNTGVRALLDRVAHHNPERLARALGSSELRKVVLIMVSAETQPDLSLDRIAAVPTVFQVIRNVKDIPINRYSFETTELFRAQFEGWAQSMRQSGVTRQPEFYLAEVTLDAVEDASERERYMRIPTSLTLPSQDVDALRRLAATLLLTAPDYQRLLRSIGDGVPVSSPATVTNLH